MGGIRVGEEELIACQITFVGKLVISSALDIAEKVFECFSVLWTRIGVEVCKVGNSMGNVRSDHNGKILEVTNSTQIGYFRHEVLFLLCAGRHGM